MADWSQYAEKVTPTEDKWSAYAESSKPQESWTDAARKAGVQHELITEPPRGSDMESGLSGNLGAAAAAAESIPGVSQLAAHIRATAGGLAPGDQGTYASRFGEIQKQQQAAAQQGAQQYPVGAAIGESAPMLVNPAAGVEGKFAAPAARIMQSGAQGAITGYTAAPEGDKAIGGVVGGALGTLGAVGGEVISAFPEIVTWLRESAAHPNKKQLEAISHSEAVAMNHPDQVRRSVSTSLKNNPEVYSGTGNNVGGYNTIQVEANAQNLAEKTGAGIGEIIKPISATPASQTLMRSTTTNVMEDLNTLVKKADPVNEARIQKAVDMVKHRLPVLDSTLEDLQNAKTMYYNASKPSLWLKASHPDDLSGAFKEVGNILKTNIEEHVAQVASPEVSAALRGLNKKYGELKLIEDVFNSAVQRGPKVLQTSAHKLTAAKAIQSTSNALEAAAKAAGVAHWNLLPPPVIAGIMQAAGGSNETTSP